MTTYIGAENIISPLGNTAEENFERAKKGESGIGLFENVGVGSEDLNLSKIKSLKIDNKFYYLLSNCLSAVIEGVAEGVIASEDTIVIVSTTKGDIEEHLRTPILNAVEQLQADFNLAHSPLIISNACISGVLAMNTANNLIQSSTYKHAFVIGADAVCSFVLYGFQSLYAVSDEPCQPFDKDRKGITLGEGAGGVFMTSFLDLFKNECFEFVEGISSNDANHISGPSRTGEGLYRTIDKTLELGGVKIEEIDFISAHGTGTLFNDEMESIAFNRHGMNQIPLNSFKGYFGHTLGAAGLIETVMSMQSMRNNTLIKSMGYANEGTSGGINVLAENQQKEVNTILKTASGFGGCNASAIIRKIK
jgi:3-oxoacyl-[acyl-carrier-protein] synthase-1